MSCLPHKQNHAHVKEQFTRGHGRGYTIYQRNVEGGAGHTATLATIGGESTIEGEGHRLRRARSGVMTGAQQECQVVIACVCMCRVD